MSGNRWNFNDVKRKLAESKRNVPIILSKQTENHFTQSFTKGALDENKWPEVQRRTPGTKAYKYKAKGISLSSWRRNPILVGTGNLRRKVSRSIHEVGWKRIRLVVDLPYAKIHNEGGMAGRNHASKIPARPYMKQTRTLTTMQNKTIETEVNKIWK